MYKCYDVAFFSFKSRRTKYEGGQSSRKNEKDKKDGENRKNEKNRGKHCRNKINLVVGENNSFKASVYYHTIYRCYQKLIVLGQNTSLSSRS